MLDRVQRLPELDNMSFLRSDGALRRTIKCNAFLFEGSEISLQLQYANGSDE